MNDALDRLITEAQPVRNADLAASAEQEVLDLSQRFLRGVETTSASDRSRRRRRAWVGAGITALLTGVVAGPAAAEWVSVHTGVTDSMTQSEEWRMDAPDAPAALMAFTSDYPLAPGYTTKPMVTQFTQKNAQMPELGARQYVWGWSQCTWEQTWLNARATKDAKTETAAAAMLASFPDRSRQPVPLFDYRTNNYDDAERLAKAVTSDPDLIVQAVAVNCAPVVVK